VEFVSVDVSFISLHVLLPVIHSWFSARGGNLVALIKPQFEATREEAARGGGVIHDPEVHRRVLTEVIQGAGPAGYRVQGVMTSPLRGQQGNREFLAWLETSEPHQSSQDPDRWIDGLGLD
jgi:23S rRNA (cytidine1920-2'-O)/16S rRNA (cytidine1409-2'-O)-methyltransferase